MICLLIFIKRHCKFIWNIIEYFNGLLIHILYRGKIEKVTSEILRTFSKDKLVYRQFEGQDAENLYTFFKRQPQEAYRYFKPHGFDLKSIQKLLKNPSFLLMGVYWDDKIVGYYFLRLFINKRSFTGYLVDYDYQGRGIAKSMGRCMLQIAWLNKFRTYATVNLNNERALAAYRAINDFRIVKYLPENYIYIEYLKEKVK